MDMDVFELDGRINEAGELEVKLPEGVRPGEVKVQIRVAQKEAQETSQPEGMYTEEELREFLNFTPKTGAEIVAMIESGELQVGGGWSEITDSVAWVEELRRKEWEQRQWRE
jgi:hypothetical protein